jgi:hypothetical protein
MLTNNNNHLLSTLNYVLIYSTIFEEICSSLFKCGCDTLYLVNIRPLPKTGIEMRTTRFDCLLVSI